MDGLSCFEGCTTQYTDLHVSLHRYGSAYVRPYGAQWPEYVVRLFSYIVVVEVECSANEKAYLS